MKTLLLLLALGVSAPAAPGIVRTLAPPLDINGKLVSGWVALGGGYYDCEERATIPQGATVLATGPTRYSDLPAGDKPNVLVVDLIRSLDGTDLKLRVQTAVATDIAPTLLSSLTPTQRRNLFIQKARQFLANQTARRLRLTVSQLAASDVDESSATGIPPHKWAGEP